MLDLESIKKREQAAIDAPWGWQRFGKEMMLVAQWGPLPVVLAANGNDIEARERMTGLLQPITACNADADFIAHARTDIPALIAEVERLRETLKRSELAADCLREAIAEAHGIPGTNSDAQLIDLMLCCCAEARKMME